MFELFFKSIYGKRLHRSFFLEHIRDMQYVEIKGELTLAKLRTVLSTHFAEENPKLLDAAKEWCDEQLKNEDQEVTEETVVISCSEENKDTSYFLHFDVITKNQN